jgi:cell division protein FtsZ
MTVRRDPPTQGSLHMDMPAPRLPDLKVDRPAAPAVEAAEEHEAPRRAGLFNRWTSARPAAPAPQQRTEPKAPAPAARPAAPAQRSGDVGAARVSPTDRLTTSRAEEDMLDIPAFLRRQAN